MTLSPSLTWLTATSCHVSYPLTSENASPLGICSVNLSCAARAMPPTTASEAVVIVIVRLLPLIFMPPLCLGELGSLRTSFRRHRYSAIGADRFDQPVSLGAEPGRRGRFSCKRAGSETGRVLPDDRHRPRRCMERRRSRARSLSCKSHRLLQLACTGRSASPEPGMPDQSPYDLGAS